MLQIAILARSILVQSLCNIEKTINNILIFLFSTFIKDMDEGFDGREEIIF